MEPITSSTPVATPAPTQSTQKAQEQKNQFLQLLVAQLKNQNPAQPMDGTTFVTQLAQFSELEQSLASRQDLDSLAAKFAPPAAASSTDDNSQKTSGT